MQLWLGSVHVLFQWGGLTDKRTSAGLGGSKESRKMWTRGRGSKIPQILRTSFMNGPPRAADEMAAVSLHGDGGESSNSYLPPAVIFILTICTGLGYKVGPRLRECCKQRQAKVVSKSSTASLSHMRTMLPESSSCPQPAQRPNHAF